MKADALVLRCWAPLALTCLAALALTVTMTVPALRQAGAAGLPWCLYLSLPPALLLAAVLSLGSLTRRRELQALAAAGVRPARALAGPCLVSALAWLLLAALPQARTGDLDPFHRLLHLESHRAFVGEHGILAYADLDLERRRLDGVWVLAYGAAPRRYASLQFELPDRGGLRLVGGPDPLPELGIRPAEPGRELRRQLLATPPLAAWSLPGVRVLHLLWLLGSVLLPLQVLRQALRFGAFAGGGRGASVALWLPAFGLALTMLLIGLMAAGHIGEAATLVLALCLHCLLLC